MTWRPVLGVRAAFIAVITIGIALGLGAYTFVYARGYSYLSNNAAACANCHIMREHYDAWNKSSHKAVATCNGCHTPHDLVGKYLTKARNGFWHSFYFTTGRFPEPIGINAGNLRITEHACRSCHADITQMIDAGAHGSQGGIRCARCHANVGHWVR